MSRRQPPGREDYKHSVVADCCQECVYGISGDFAATQLPWCCFSQETLNGVESVCSKSKFLFCLRINI